MAPPPEAERKKKKKRKRKEESGTVFTNETLHEERGNEETRGGNKETRGGNEGVKKKKKKAKKNKEICETTVDLTSSLEPVETTRGTEEKKQGEKRTPGGEEVMRKKSQKRRPPAEEEPEATDVQTPTDSRKKKKRKPTMKLQTQNELNDTDMEPSDSYTTGVSEADFVELEEFVPNIRSRSVDVINKMKRYDLERFREFKRQGLKVRWGKYTQQENLQIRRNVEDLLKLTGIGTVDELFFPSRYPDRQLHLKSLRAQHGFYFKLAGGLQRTCEQVYIRGKKIFDSRNHQGRFSEEELQALQKLQTIHGNNWKTIGDKLDRSVYSCEKRGATLGFHSGPWSPEELQRFKRAMKKHLKNLRTSWNAAAGPDPGPSWEQLCAKLPWAKISLKVQTRSWLQCRAKWFTFLKSRLKATKPKEISGSSLQMRIRLIQVLYELQVEDVFDVDWVDISKSVGGLTPECAQKMFHRMKASRVAGWTSLSFGEIVDILFERELPKLQTNLQKNLQKSLLCPEPEPGPDHFSLDQIFPKDQDEFMELDNT